MPSGNVRVLVVGAGIVGRSIAYYLAHAGIVVHVVDGDRRPSPTSRASLGVLTHPNGGDDQLSSFYRECHTSHGELSVRLLEETGIDVGWQELGGIDLFLAEDRKEDADDLIAFNHSRNCRAELVEGGRLSELEPQLAPGVTAGVFFPDDHRVNPEALAEALLTSAARIGVQVSFGTRLKRIDAVDSGGVRVTLSSEQGDRSEGADCLVLAAGARTGELTAAAGLELAVRPIRGQQCRFRGDGAVRHILRHGGHHLLPAGGEIVVGGTVEDVGFDLETTEDAERMFTALCSQVLAVKPSLTDQRAGLRPKSKKGRPVIGPLDADGQLFVATGHYKNGVLMGPMTGRVVAEWISTGAPSLDMSVFAPKV